MAFECDAMTGQVRPARQVPSPNHDERPIGAAPELIVVHCISLPPGQYGGPWIDRLFTNRLPPEEHPYFGAIARLEVSAHLLIRRDGSVTQYVPIHMRAWHAGQSCYEGRVACNDFSVGIELEGTDDSEFDSRQYDTLAQLIDCLCRSYPTLSPQRVVGHSDIAPERKTDPGERFDWHRLHAMLRAGESDSRFA